MPGTLTYQQLVHNVLLRGNAMIGAQAGPLDTTYNVAVLTSANSDSADFPFGATRDAVIMGVESVSKTIANGNDNTAKAYFQSQTAALSNISDIPAVDAFGVGIIGVLGAVHDNVSGTPLTEMSLDEITRFNRNAGGQYVCPVYGFKIWGGKIYCTRPTVTITCNVFSRAAQLTLFNSNGIVPLPDTEEPSITSFAISMLTRDGVYESQAQIYRSYYMQAMADYQQGSGADTGMAKTAPTLGAPA